jgi:hypothetical protein
LIKKDTVVIGICLPRKLKEIVDKARGDIPRSTYISKLLEKLYEKEHEQNLGAIGDERLSKPINQPRNNSASFPSVDRSASTTEIDLNEQ